ncbi:MAG: hypothetical protein J5593_02610 [Bacteroidaceae bacterium]|nr:hypothetical protein [Bacteroidaceae bacterium]
MKKILFFVFVFVFVNVCAEDYGIKVGGVSVTSSNCTNITGDRINCYKSGQEYYAKYNPSTNTLTLKNVSIIRTGKNNRAIYNTGCDNLTIVLDGPNLLMAEDAAPVRVEKHTVIKTTNTKDIKDCMIIGKNEDGIYIADGKWLTLADAALYVSGGSNSCGIVGQKGTESLLLRNASLWVDSRNSDNSDGYALWDIGLLRLQDDSAIKIETDKNCPVKNLRKIERTSGTNILPNKVGDAYKSVVYSSKQQTFLYKSSDSTKVDKLVQICFAYNINTYMFPDDTFRSIIRNMSIGRDGYLIMNNPYGQIEGNINREFMHDEVSAIKSMTVDEYAVASLKGIKYFPNLEELVCHGLSLTELDLSENRKLREVDCVNNKLTSLILPASSSLKRIDCYGNKFTTKAVTQIIDSLPTVTDTRYVYLVDHSNSAEVNKCSAQQVKKAEKRGWKIMHNYNGSWTPTAGCPHIYKLTYYIDDTVYKTVEVEEGKAVTPLANPEDDDYFYAWEDEPTTMPNHDVEVHAVITAIQGLESRVKGEEKGIYYDVNGRKVTNPGKGIYIRNKKKIVIK